MLVMKANNYFSTFYLKPFLYILSLFDIADKVLLELLRDFHLQIANGHDIMKGLLNLVIIFLIREESTLDAIHMILITE